MLNNISTCPGSCFYSLFNGCTSLLTAPELPATAISTGSYNSMFRDCTALTTGPSRLPATSLGGSSCYYNMFYGCSSLSGAP